MSLQINPDLGILQSAGHIWPFSCPVWSVASAVSVLTEGVVLTVGQVIWEGTGGAKGISGGQGEIDISEEWGHGGWGLC